MKSLLEKSWSNNLLPSQRKYLSRVLTHQLSRKLGHLYYDVVYESALDRKDPESEVPDVVIYSSDKSFKPVVAIEICDTSDLIELTITARILLDQYQLHEFFILDYKTNLWYRLTAHPDAFSETSYSPLLGFNLGGLLESQGHLFQQKREDLQEKDFEIYSNYFQKILRNSK